MCGLSGLAGSIAPSDKQYATEMLILNIPRGKDSTGIAGVSRDAKEGVRMAKALGTPFGDAYGEVGLFGYKSFDKVMSAGNLALIGHNRAATKGEVSVRNQHPFWFPKIVGAHNGTLEYQSHRLLLGHGVHGTDSECLFNSINEWGLSDTIGKIQGAWALTWYDFETKTINLLRNSERTLYYVFAKSNRTLYWSSDWEPMVYALRRAKIDIGENKPALLAEDTHLSWVVPEMGKEFGEPTRTAVKGKPPLPLVLRTETGQSGSRTSTPTSQWPRTQGQTQSIPPLKNAIPMAYDKTLGAFVPVMKASVVTKTENGVTTQEGCSAARQKLLDRLAEVREGRFIQQHGTPGTGVVLKYKDVSNKVFWSKTMEDWLWYNYETHKNEWKMYRSDVPPPALPYKMVNLDAGGCHNFSYAKPKKGEARHIYYKGFQGNLLSKERFTRLMEEGCLNCQKTPTWGNIVRFVSHDNFLCEHCAEMPNVRRFMMLDAEDNTKIANA